MVNEQEICLRCRPLALNSHGVVEATSPREVDKRGPIPLQYRLQDQFPQFPKLTITIKKGCPICSFVKDMFWSHIRSSADLLELANSALEKDKRDPGASNLKVQLELLERRPRSSAAFRPEGARTWIDWLITGQISVGPLTQAVQIEAREKSFGSFPCLISIEFH